MAKNKIPFLSKAELKMISQLLEEASEEYSNNGCNDYKVPATEENKKMVAEMIEANNDIDWQDDVRDVMNTKDEIFTYDWMLMSHLANRCKKLSEK